MSMIPATEYTSDTYNSELFSFQLGKKLGEGSYGRVHECRFLKINLQSSQIPHCQYAAKILKKNQKDGIDCPLELSIMASYRHPCIGYAIGIVYDSCNVYIIQEKADSDLEVYLKEGRTPDRDRWFLSLLQGVKFLHSESIIHGDIKPSNVLVMLDGSVRLTDYSHSVLLSKEDSCFRKKVGSPRYSAPEILSGHLWCKPIDIWSLGCVFYEISTGIKFLSNIHSKSTDKDLILSIEQNSFRNAKFASDGDKELVLDYMLQYEPYDRFTAQELLRMFFDQAEQPAYQKMIPEGEGLLDSFEYIEVLRSRTKDQAILKLINNINKRTGNIPVTLVKIDACHLLASKLLQKTFPSNLVFSPLNKILEMELKICTEIGFILHY